MIMLLLGHWAQGGVSIVRNGSFENDGGISPITAEDAPQYWCDVNIPSDKFNGWVDSDWWTHSYNDGDGNSLTLSSAIFVSLAGGDMAMVSQEVYLTDVNEIIFDLKLGTIGGEAWDPVTRSALALIDGNEVWDSNVLELDENGEFLGQVEIDANNFQIYKDANSHTLSLAMRVKVGGTYFSEYVARWDFVKFDTHCGGFGYLPEDLNYDCYVDFLDFAMLANHWLEENPAYKYDLFGDGVVNEYDLMVFAEGWLDCSYWENWQDDNCYEVELLAADLNLDGVVDFRDFAILAGDWGSDDNCIAADVDNSGEVDYHDISIMADEWLQKSWLYGL